MHERSEPKDEATGTGTVAGTPPVRRAEEGRERDRGRAEERDGREGRQEGQGLRRAFVAAWCAQQELKFPKLHEKIAKWLDAKWRADRKPKRLLLMVFRDAGKSTLVGLFAPGCSARTRTCACSSSRPRPGSPPR